MFTNNPRRLFATVLVTALSLATGQLDAQLAIHGDLVHTVDGEVMADAVILTRDGKIERIGPKSEMEIPADYRILEAAVVTPGLIDSHSVMGLAGALNARVEKGQSSVRVHDQDQIELSDPLQPELRAIDAYDPSERLIAWARSLGVTTAQVGHAPGAVISGQAMIVKTGGENHDQVAVDQVVVDPASALTITLGASPGENYDSPGTRAKTVALLRDALVGAQAYQRKLADSESEKTTDRSLRNEALAQLLDGDLTAIVTAQRAPEIATALRLADEFGFRLWLDGCGECYLLLDEIAAAKVPVLLHPPMTRATGERINIAFDTPLRLHRAGIPFAFQSGYEAYVPKVRVLLWEAAMAVRYGLPSDAALRALTLGAAEILGLDDRIGSLSPGKDADIVLFDGDPFEYTSHVCGVVIDGRLVSDTCR